MKAAWSVEERRADDLVGRLYERGTLAEAEEILAALDAGELLGEPEAANDVLERLAKRCR